MTSIFARTFSDTLSSIGYFGYHHLKAYLSLGITLTDLTMIIDQVRDSEGD